jgi:hypothetical protein
VVKTFVLGKEPALLLSLLAAVLGVGAALGLPGLSAGQATLIIAALTAVLGAVQALYTRPWPPAVAGAVAALAALGAGYGFHIAPGVLSAVDAVVLALAALLVRGQVTPLIKLRMEAAHSPRPVS